MNARHVFVSETGVLRAPWRIIVFCLVSMGALIVAAVIVGPIVSQFYALAGVHGVSNEAWIECAGLLGGTAISLRMIDKRPWRDVWLSRGAARPSLLAIGFALGTLAIGVPIVGLIAGHWVSETPGGGGSWWGAMARITLVLLPAAFMEELMTRGYILAVLREWWGWKWAIFATSVAFGLLHLWNAGATPASVGLVTLAGFFLAGILYFTQSLYAAWMAHFAWNWTMAALFHASVSGYPFESPYYRYVDSGPDWATGGAWGPEGGIPAALGMIAALAILFFIWRKRRWPNEWP